MEYQTITELIEALKMAGKVYNDADFARKTGLKQSMTADGLRTGLMVAAAGAVVVAASFIPLARPRVRLDGNSLVIPLH